ncbi:ImmA/IrrE family metallo-endopeptidase [Acetobacterium tundrae]|uniref:ImmA/IrrE family metallo-endopeptidase n=1 Tax=Acetobacterium tundrae TaxID=132932 RepID=A0ABR6WK16_9FIRM|nr:ImmA/IrrE family metallo-endopeptidase [Acetobacterium tundrae]MBC3796467.1 ImmA/IrrE family metallo-endopeptidase [Acetobacterium tundrae]
MYTTQRMKSIFLHKKYNLTTFPIPIWQIEQIIIDRGYDICISDKSKASFILNTTVFVPNICDSLTRFYLSHELGHIICNHYDVYLVDKYTKSKYECQANAFAACFLMPTHRFKIDSKIYNSYELSELYGVPVEFINSCVKKYLVN